MPTFSLLLLRLPISSLSWLTASLTLRIYFSHLRKNRRRSLISSYSLQATTMSNQVGLYFLTGFFAGEAAFFATFLAGAFLAAGFLAGAGFLAAGFAVAFFAAGIS